MSATKTTTLERLHDEKRTLMRALFEHGDFSHILENIFFYLDPKSLLSCSQVNKQWQSFIQKCIFSTLSGERRITHNWLNEKPSVRRTRLMKEDESRVRSIAVNDKFIVVSMTKGLVNLYDRVTMRYKWRLHNLGQCPHSSQSDSWRLSMSSAYLIVYAFDVFEYAQFIFKVIKGHLKLVNTMSHDPRLAWLKDIHLVRQDVMVVHRSGSEEFIEAIKLSNFEEPDHPSYVWLWSICISDFQGPPVFYVDDVSLITCDKMPFHCWSDLRMYSVVDGSLVKQIEFETEGDSYDRVLSISSASPTIVLVLTEGFYSKAEGGKIYVCDLNEVNVLARVLVLPPLCFFGGEMWCNASMGILLVNKVLVYELRDLLEADSYYPELQWVDLGKKMERWTKILGDKNEYLEYSPKIVLDRNRLIILDKEEGCIMDCDFWGKF